MANKAKLKGPRATIQKKLNMLRALEGSLGVVTTAAEASGITRMTHYNWMKADEEYKRRVYDIEEAALDFAESKLHDQIDQGSTTATIFYLKCKGKHRGYIERKEVEIDTAKMAKIEIIASSPDGIEEEE